MDPSSPSCRVDPVEHRHDQSRVVHPKAPIQTYDLRHSGDSQEDKRENRREVPKLISSVLVRRYAGDEFYSRFSEHEAHPRQTSPAARPTDSQSPGNLRVIAGRGPRLQLLFYPKQPRFDVEFDLGRYFGVVWKPPLGADARKRLRG